MKNKKLLVLKEPRYYDIEHMEQTKLWFNIIKELCEDSDTIPILIPREIEIIEYKK